MMNLTESSGTLEMKIMALVSIHKDDDEYADELYAAEDEE